MKRTDVGTRLSVIFILALFFIAMAPSTGAQPVELLANGGFESGNLGGWVAFTTGAPFGPWRVDGPGYGMGFGLSQTNPQEGNYVAWNGFDGFGPMTFIMFQNVTIPADHSASLQWNDRVQWNFTLAQLATKPRVYEVQVQDPATGAVLEVVKSFMTGTQDTTPTGDTGWVFHEADLSAYAGEEIRLAFYEEVPEFLTGPGQLEVDGISLLAEEQLNQEIVVPVDIKPGSCPNPFNAWKRGVVPVAILGSADLDIGEIDESSIALAGVSPIRVAWEDVASPGAVDGELSTCDDCSVSDPDGLTDLVLKFDAQELVAGIEALFEEMPGDRECLILPVTGVLTDGSAIYGEDTVLFLNHSGGQGRKAFADLK